jgi:hydroxymethylpyrimidine pyrophosphatase-like HAD family hydrolase
MTRGWVILLDIDGTLVGPDDSDSPETWRNALQDWWADAVEGKCDEAVTWEIHLLTSRDHPGPARVPIRLPLPKSGVVTKVTIAWQHGVDRSTFDADGTECFCSGVSLPSQTGMEAAEWVRMQQPFPVEGTWSIKTHSCAVHWRNALDRATQRRWVEAGQRDGGWWVRFGRAGRTMEVFPPGFGKERAVDEILDRAGVESAVWIADRIEPLGNDWNVALHPRVRRAYRTPGPESTARWVRLLLEGLDLDRDEEAFQSVPSLQPPTLWDGRNDTLPPKVCCFDFDDTLTAVGAHRGERGIPATLFQELDALASLGVDCWIVSGRSLAWCQAWLHTLPFVKGVIGENGAFFLLANQPDEVHWCGKTPPCPVRRAAWQRLVWSRVEEKHPALRQAPDQMGRVCDLAIDYSHLDDMESRIAVAGELHRLLTDLAKQENLGIQWKASSIHLNVWEGAHDKLSAWKTVRGRFYADVCPQQCWYFGDSPNDEVMFAHFCNSVAVANYRPFLEQAETYPRWITALPGGHGVQSVLTSLREAMTEKGRGPPTR